MQEVTVRKLGDCYLLVYWLSPLSSPSPSTPAPFPIPLQKERGFGLLLFVKHLLNANNLVGPVLRT